jgi:NADPH:quinone reductase-like Zn-dependent oxidoreductase
MTKDRETMSRSIVLNGFGGPEVLRIQQTSVPLPAPDEVRLRIHAIGINRTEITLRSGRSVVKPALPTGIGFEAAGEIETIGANVTGYSIGDRVALIPTYNAAQYGLYGELSLAPARSLVKVPDQMSFVDAAATWVAFGTAWGGVRSVGSLTPGETVLITAASSSVGLAAIQIANRMGARAIAVTRTMRKAEALRSHGAAYVIATAEQQLESEVKRLTDGNGADLVFDAVGGPGFSALAKSTKTGGLIVLYGALDTNATVVSPFDVFARDLTIRGLALPALAKDEQAREALKSFVQTGLDVGSLRPVIAKTFPFDEIANAHRYVESAEHIGKVVIAVS